MRTISKAALSQKVILRPGRAPQVWGTCKVQAVSGAMEETKILCCNGDGTGWIYDLTEEAEGRDDLSFYEAIDKDTEECVLVVGEPDAVASDLICA